MSKHHFTFQEVFMFGWSKTKQHAWFVFLTCLISSSIISATIISPFLNTVIVLMSALSLASISLMIARNHAFSFGDLFSPLLSYKRVLKFFALFALYVIPITLLGLAFAILTLGAAKGSASVTIFGIVLSILLLVPSIFIAVRFKFFPFIVAEHEHASVKDLVMMSYKLTENNFWAILGFMCLAAILNFAGVLFFGIGLLVTIPTTFFASAHLYDMLKHHEA